MRENGQSLHRICITRTTENRPLLKYVIIVLNFVEMVFDLIACVCSMFVVWQMITGARIIAYQMARDIHNTNNNHNDTQYVVRQCGGEK